METNDYQVITHWRVPGTQEEVYDIFANARDLARWWPSVYLDVQVLEHGDVNGKGQVVSLYTKGWLPYTLRWSFRVSEVEKPRGCTLVSNGDFVGRGIWTFEQDGPWVNITYDWKIQAEKPLLRRLSFIFKPIFTANHRWAMAKGKESLLLELARRHAATDAERHRIPEPPRPTGALPIVGLISAGLVAAGALGYLIWKALAALVG